MFPWSWKEEKDKKRSEEEKGEFRGEEEEENGKEECVCVFSGRWAVGWGPGGAVPAGLAAPPSNSDTVTGMAICPATHTHRLVNVQEPHGQLRAEGKHSAPDNSAKFNCTLTMLNLRNLTYRSPRETKPSPTQTRAWCYYQ